jgi:pimeloyl-ACP methyl ester carboxylesterase
MESKVTIFSELIHPSHIQYTDRSCVPSMANYLIRTIPNATEFRSDEHGHMYFFEAWESILQQLLRLQQSL